MELLKIKKELIEFSKQFVLKKLEELENTNQSLKDSAGTDTKSTAGDKHETFKALMHLEQEKIQKQTQDMMKQLKIVQQFEPEIHTKIKNTTVLECKNKTFFIGLPIGNIPINNQSYFSVSINSPIIQEFIKTNSNKIVFNNIEYEIIKLY